MDSLFIHPEYPDWTTVFSIVRRTYTDTWLPTSCSHTAVQWEPDCTFDITTTICRPFGDNELELLNCPFLLFNLMYLGKIPLGAPIFQFHCAGYI